MFARLDLFGKPVVLNFNGKDKSQTFAGAWFSLLFVGFVGLAICYLGQDLINRSNPKTITAELFDEDPKTMILSPNTFNFAFGLQHPMTYAHYMNESIYTVEAIREQLVRVVKEDGNVELNWTYTSYLLETCTPGHFGPLAFTFENLELNQLYCLKIDQPEEIRIQGAFESPVFEDVLVVFRECDNKTSKVPCAPQEVLDDLLGGGWFATYFTNLAIEPRNYSYPNFGYKDSYYSSMSNSYYKEISLWLNHVEVASNYGWLTDEFKTDRFIKLDHTTEYTSFRPNIDRMIDFVIRVGRIKKYYERSYIKVQDVIAQANGFISAGIIIISLFMMPYSKIKFFERLINELFDVKTLRKAKKERTKLFNKKLSSQMTEKIKSSGEEGALGLTLDVFEKYNYHYDAIPPSPNFVKKFGKINVAPPKHMEFIHSPKNLSSKGKICSISELKSYISSRNSILGEPKAMKFVKAENNLEKIKEQTQENILPAPISIKKSQHFFPFAGHLQPDKPLKTDPPKIKSVQSLEVEEPGVNFFDIENQMTDKPLLKQSDRDPRSPRETERLNTVGLIDHQEVSMIRKKQRKKVNRDIHENIVQRAELIPGQLIKDSGQINISFGEYLRSYFWKSKALKEKLSLLEEGIRRIEERLNIFNLLKKLREVDKLKLLLLENEQFVLFDALPNPELSLAHNKVSSRSFSHNQLKEAQFIAEKRKHELVKYSYIDLKERSEPTMIDEKLLEIYDDIINF